MSNLIEDIAATHRAQHFLGVRVGNSVLELSASRAAPPTFDCNRCCTVCDTHSDLLPVVIRYQPIANSNASGDGVFPTVIGNQKLSLNFYCHCRGTSLLRCATRTTTPSKGVINSCCLIRSPRWHGRAALRFL